MGFSLLELFGEDSLDAVDAHGNGRGREAGDLADGGGVEFFEIGNDDLAVDGAELLNQGLELIELPLVGLVGCRVRQGEVVEIDEGGAGATLADEVRCRYVVGDTVSPGPERAATVEMGEAAPELEVDFLAEVVAAVGVGLVGGDQAGEGWAESRCGLME